MAGKEELDELFLEEEEDNIITLTDEDGNEENFELLDAIDLEGNTYVVLLPAAPADDAEDSDEVLILQQVGSDDPDEDTFESVEDDEVLKKVYDLFKERFKDEFEFED